VNRPLQAKWPVIAFVLIVLIGGLNALGVRYTVLELPPFWGAALRFGPAAVLLLLLGLLLKVPLPGGRGLAGAVLYGALNFGFSYAFIYVGLQKVQAGTAQVILATAPLFTLVFAVAHRQESFRWRGLLGALVAVGGIAVVFARELLTAVPFFSLLAVVVGAACLAEGSVVVKGFPKSDPIMTNAIGMAAGTLILMAMSLLWHEERALPALAVTWAAIVYLSLIGSCLLFILLVNLLKRWPASALSYAFVLFPFVSLTASALLMQEPVGPLLLAGAALVLGGAYLGISSPARKTAGMERQQVTRRGPAEGNAGEKADTIIIGGGQGGLVTSYHLKQGGREHLVLEQAAGPANAWRNDRWDSFTLVTPNWSFRLPGAEYQGEAREGFMRREEVVTRFEKYVERYNLPVRYQVRVSSVEPEEISGGYRVEADGGRWLARNVVVATGLYQRPRIPSFSRDLSSSLTQLHSGQYRNPGMLPEGAVLVAGSGQSGCQIAEELYRSGRKVYLSVGRGGRAPRRYRGKDVYEWMHLSGFLDRTPEQLESPAARFDANPQVTGHEGGRSLNLHRFARDGVTLLGRIQGGQGQRICFAPDLQENLARIDQKEAELTRMIDAYINLADLEAPPETLPDLRDGYAGEPPTELDLQAAGVRTVLWATGYNFNFNMIKLPVFDQHGYPRQKNGATECPGLFFVGLPWLTRFKSGHIFGVGEDAAAIAKAISGRS
jgi:putative flavoprotein involved in K+ transport